MPFLSRFNLSVLSFLGTKLNLLAGLIFRRSRNLRYRAVRAQLLKITMHTSRVTKPLPLRRSKASIVAKLRYYEISRDTLLIHNADKCEQSKVDLSYYVKRLT